MGEMAIKREKGGEKRVGVYIRLYRGTLEI
jgi:hypothetical protein